MENPHDPYAPMGETSPQRTERLRQEKDYSDAWSRYTTWEIERNKPNSGGFGSTGGFGGNSGGSGAQKLVCNELYKQGHISQNQFFSSMRDFRERLTPTHLRGYHVWAVPLVRLMRRSKPISRFVATLFVKRMSYVASKNDSTVEVAYGVRFFCRAGEHISLLIGKVVKSENRWQKVYDTKNKPAQVG